MKQQPLLIVMYVTVTLLPLLTTAIECSSCGNADICSTMEWGDCIGCTCKCNTVLDCGPGEICSEVEGLFPCFGDDCPRSCTSTPDSILSLAPPEDADVAGIGASVLTTDDADSDDSSTSSQDNGGGGDCVKSCDPSQLCSYFTPQMCTKYPQAKCKPDACKCEALFVDDDGNEVNCLGGSSQGDDGPPDNWLPSLPGDDEGDVFVPADVTTTPAPPSSSTDEKSGDVENDDDVTEAERRKNSVFHQVIIPTFLVVVVIVVAFLIWKGYGKWMRRNAKNKQLRDDKKAAAAADLEESSRPLNRPTPADANV